MECIAPTLIAGRCLIERNVESKCEEQRDEGDGEDDDRNRWWET
jgi:hypothetical protein